GLTKLSLSEASQLIRSRKVSPVELTRECLSRIERLNSKLNAFITVTGDAALAEAGEAEAEIQDTLAWANACLTEESFGERSEPRRLSNQALVLGVGAAESILRSGTDLCHLSGEYYHALISCRHPSPLPQSIACLNPGPPCRAS